MAIRPILLAALAIGSALPGQALAQYYPPPGYRMAPPADIYRGPPPADLDDDDDDVPGGPRGPYVIPGPGPYRAVPGPYRAVPGPYEEARRYPGERYDRYGPPPYRDVEPYAPPRPPAAIYPDDARTPPPPPGYGRQPQYPAYPPQDANRQPGHGAQPGYGAQPSPGAQPPYGARPGYEPERPTGSIGRNNPAVAALPPDYEPEQGTPKELPQHLRRQLVDYRTKEPAGTLVIDTPNTYLYLVLGNGKAMRYGIGVGREGFTWAGEERISKMAEWPDWHPPAEMIERQPYLPRFMAGGPSNPLGARALYLGKSIYRIHGTNQPSTIGQFVSSGCIRLVNDDIEDLYSRVQVGTRVVVLAGGKPASAGAAREISPPQVVR
jgi:lipoprotein-anchoring transpeptidase ErfK/SrfK